MYVFADYGGHTLLACRNRCMWQLYVALCEYRDVQFEPAKIHFNQIRILCIKSSWIWIWIWICCTVKVFFDL